MIDCYVAPSIVSPIVHDNFVTNIPLPKPVTDVPVSTITVPEFDVSKTILTRFFNNKTFKLYKSCSVDDIVINLSHKMLSESE